MESIHTLEKVLSSYTVENLNEWASILDINLSSKLRKAERVKSLAQIIRKFPQEVAKHLPTFNLQFFLDIINGKLSKAQYDFFNQHISICGLGLIYALKSKGYNPAFQEDLAGVYKPVIEAELEHRRKSGIDVLEKYVIGFTNIFGSMTLLGYALALEKLKSHINIPDGDMQFWSEGLKILSSCSVPDEDQLFLISPYVLFMDDFDPSDYTPKEFDSDFILGMGEMPFMKFNLPSAKRLESYMESKGIPHDEIQLAMTEMWVHHLSQSPNKEFLDIIGRYSPDVRTAAELYTAAADFVNDLPMWQYRGLSSNEVKEIEDRKKRERDIRCGRNIIGHTPMSIAIGKKPGRNDPCPCGSGKKYKHCCGR